MTSIFVRVRLEVARYTGIIESVNEVLTEGYVFGRGFFSWRRLSQSAACKLIQNG